MKYYLTTPYNIIYLVEDWCDKNLGKCGQRWTRWTNTFYFHEESDLLMVTLKWL